MRMLIGTEGFEAEIIVREPGEKHPVVMMDEWDQHRVYGTMLQHKGQSRSFNLDAETGTRGLTPKLMYGEPDHYDWFEKKPKQVLTYIRDQMKVEHSVVLRVNGSDLQQTLNWGIEDDSPSDSNVIRRTMREQMRNKEIDTYVVFPFTKFRTVPRPIKRYVRYWDENDKDTMDGMVCDLQFLDDNDNVVLEIRTTSTGNHYHASTLPYRRGETWAKTPKTVPYGGQQKQDAIPLVKDYGCAGCGNAEYVVRGPEVFLRCTKYGGEVLETAYDGSYYPDYCGRADAEKIRKMRAFSA